MTTNELRIAATLLVGNKVHTLVESVAREDWERWDHIERAGAYNALKFRLARTITERELMSQIQVCDVADNTATYKIHAGGED